MESVTVTLTREEAESFRKWREHQARFEVMLAAHVFDIREGSAEMHFNGAGEITAINAHIKLLRRAQIIVAFPQAADLTGNNMPV